MDITFSSRFKPLDKVLVYDVFNNGLNGWMEIMPNFCEAPDFGESPSIVIKSQWPPVMLSTATFRYPGSHGSLSGQYSLKVSTRPIANPYAAPPAAGSLGQAIKRLSFHHLKRKYLQFEMWFAYTAEQDKVDGSGPQPGLHESSIRSFGFGWDLQERGNRYFSGVRYLNSVDGRLQKKWQFIYPSSKDDKDWAFDTEGDWCIKGVDPFWCAKRYPDGRHDGYLDVPNGQQSLCYNETDCKLNWQYARLLIDTEKREYIEMQCQDKTFDLGRHPIYCTAPYERIDGLMNPLMWVETDTNRRVFLYVDSVVISQE
ncbi:DUF6772 family protein [Niabella aurantiaca]|uniref:DUF6772 family protein n=1 Tax=Niabella aurantiaca TaxID=379900 RepID=UPI000361D2E6|nr:DUF6772 family protein [Niabella aurantiaca]